MPCVTDLSPLRPWSSVSRPVRAVRVGDGVSPDNVCRRGDVALLVRSGSGHRRGAATPWSTSGRAGPRTGRPSMAPAGSRRGPEGSVGHGAVVGPSLAALSWDVLGLDTGPNQYHLTLSVLTQAYRPLNAGVLLCWILVGIGYQVARVRSPRRSKMAWEDMTTGREPEQPGGRLGAAGIAGAGGSGRGFTPGMLLPQHPVVGVVFWVAVPVAAVVVDQVARRSDGRLATAEELVRFVSTRPAVNVVCVTAWVFAGTTSSPADHFTR